MKKGIYLALSMMLVLGAFTACGGGKDKDNDNNTSDPIETPAVSEGGEGEGSEGGEGGENQKPVIPEDLDVAGAIAFAKDYASKVTHGKLLNITDSMYGSTEEVLYSFGEDFTYVKSTTRAGEGEFAYEDVYEAWNSLDENGNIFAIKNGNPSDEETSVDMMNGFGFNLSYVWGDFSIVYGVDALVEALYEKASGDYAYYQQCLEDAKTAEDEELIANVQYVIDNCGFSENVSEEGVFSFTMDYYSNNWDTYCKINVEFTLSDEGYMATAKVESTQYGYNMITPEVKTIVRAVEGGREEETATVYALKAEVEYEEEQVNEETGETEYITVVGPATPSTIYTINATQNCALTEEDVIPTENAYPADKMLVEQFTLSQGGKEVADGANLSVEVGTTIALDITVDESKMAFSKMSFKLNDEVMVDAYDDSRIAITHSTYNDETWEEENVLRLNTRQVGTYTITVIYGKAIKTLNVEVTPVTTNELNASAYVDYEWVSDSANVYVGTALEMKVEANQYADASHTYAIVSDNADDMTLTLNEDGTYTFTSKVAGTYEIKFISTYSTADNEIADTFTVVVEEAPSVAEILNGYYAVYSWGSKKASLAFTPASEGATSGTVAVETTQRTSDGSSKSVSAVFSYAYTEENGLSWAYVSGDEFSIFLSITDNYGLQFNMEDCVKEDAPSGEPEVVFASELYYDELNGVYLIINKEYKRGYVCSTTNPNGMNEICVMFAYEISANGVLTINVLDSKGEINPGLTGAGNYYVAMDYVEIGYTHPKLGSQNYQFAVAGNEGGEEGGEEGGDEGSLGIEGTINVTTTDNYCWVDKYTFTAEKAGTYTFTVPAGLGVWEAEACDTNSADPEIDYYANENGGTFSVTLAEGEKFSFYVAATTKGDWVISYVA